MHNEDDRCRIHQLPEFEECGYLPSFEYPLPVSGMPAEHRDALSPWIAGLTHLDSDRAHSSLRERWALDLSGRFGSLLEYFLQFRPTSVVVQDDQSWLMAVRPESESTRSTFFLIPDPVDRAELESRLAACGLHERGLIRLLGAIAGLREDFAPSGGAFIDLADTWISLDQPWMQQVLTNYLTWEGSLVFFTSRGGDSLLMHSDAGVGWWGAGEDAVTSYAESFEEFCERYAHFRFNAWRPDRGTGKLIAWPFDAYDSRQY